MSVTNTVSNSFTSTVTISASIVSVAVGFNVTATESITDSYSMQVPAGEDRIYRGASIFGYLLF